MDDPGNLSERTLPELKQIVADFPYFHAARMLYLKNLAVLDDIRLKVDLKKMAIYLPDRTKLFILLDGDKYVKPVAKLHKQEDIQKENKFTLVDSFLSETTDSGKNIIDESLIFHPPVSADYMQLLLDDEPKSEGSDKKMQHQELIDSFIESGSEHFGKRLVMDSSANEGENFNIENTPLNLEKETLDVSYFTETLAHVHIKQKRYDKALEIIKNLSLKYPEKNIYFADQIRFLEKLIIHTKK
jgi:hypothetical protein